MIQGFGLAAFVSVALTNLLEQVLLIRVWKLQPEWAEEADFHEPSWVTRSPKRRWRFFFAILRFDHHLRTNPVDTALLAGCWLANLAMFFCMAGLIYALATK